MWTRYGWIIPLVIIFVIVILIIIGVFGFDVHVGH